MMLASYHERLAANDDIVVEGAFILPHGLVDGRAIPPGALVGILLSV
jgi:hypothetical protein